MGSSGPPAFRKNGLRQYAPSRNGAGRSFLCAPPKTVPRKNCFCRMDSGEEGDMKKLTAILMCVICLAGLAAPAASALSLYDGTAALDASFLDGEVKNGFDYVWYSPWKGESDQTAYPLTVWLHGMKSGTERRAQLKWYEFSNWASEEYQARFADAGGCYLLAVRASDSDINSWTGDSCAKLKLTIDKFIAANEAHIDKKRIYIAGYSTGGAAVWDMLAQYPGFFAAGIPIAAVLQPTAEETAKLADTSVWIFSSDNDPYVLAGSRDAELAFRQLKNSTHRPTGVRMTTVSDARFADNSKRYDLSTGNLTWDAEHFIWEAVTYDMHLMDGVTPYPYTATTDAAGNAISFEAPTEGVISWLSAQRLAENQTSAKVGFFEKIRLFFEKIFAYFRLLFGGH